MPRGPRRGDEDEAGRSFRVLGGKLQSDEAAERHAAHDRSPNPALVEGLPHLRDVVVEAARGLKAELRRRLVGECKRDHTTPA